MIDARGIRVRAGGRTLLDGVSVTLRAGTVTAVLGPNGAGKTTLLRVLSGAKRPDEGAVTMDGMLLHTMIRASLARRRAVLGQHQPLEFGLRVAEVVALGRLPHAGAPSARDDAVAIAAARDTFALEPLWRRAYPSLSGGERQRTHLARVAAQLWRPGSARAEFRALFLDEPTAALDLTQQSTALHFARVAAQDAAAVLMVVHDPNHAAMADDVIMMRNGKIQDAGPVSEVLKAETVRDCFGVQIEVLQRADGRVGMLPL